MIFGLSNYVSLSIAIVIVVVAVAIWWLMGRRK
jgi:low affinity Fe/Cu permease